MSEVKDREINRAEFTTLNLEGGVIKRKTADTFSVGDLLILYPNERAPADIVLLWTSDPSGSIFIRTD